MGHKIPGCYHPGRHVRRVALTSLTFLYRGLLHIMVPDTSDDVWRAALTSLAFLLFKNPGQVPYIVQLLSESYNPHVHRGGTTLALGIACAGTSLQDAVEILSSPSMSSTCALYTKFVSDKHGDLMARFGAVIGQGLIDY